MLHRVEIYDKTGSVQLTTMLQPSIFNLSYVNELSKSGSATFSVQVKDSKSTALNLKLFNRIKIYRGTVGVFYGYIESLTAGVNIIDIRCVGMLGYFVNRLTSTTPTSVQADVALYAILTATNSDDATGISQGTSDVTTTINDVKFSRSKILSAWQKIANMTAGEIEIDINGNLNFKQQLGVDRSGSVIFQYLVNQINTATVYDFDVELTAKNMANKVTGTGNSSLISTQSDAGSITEFGLLEESKNFAQTDNQTDLDSETLDWITAHKDEFYTPRIQPNISKIDIDSYEVGDTVKVVLSNGFIVINANHRIIRKQVDVSDNDTPVVDINLIPTGTNLLPSSFFEDIIDQGDRISLLEGSI